VPAKNPVNIPFIDLQQEEFAKELFEAAKRAFHEANTWLPSQNKSWEGLIPAERNAWRKLAQRVTYIVLSKQRPSQN
jgi:hypothetical protein